MKMNSYRCEKIGGQNWVKNEKKLLVFEYTKCPFDLL